jgi:hypothetical protein
MTLITLAAVWALAFGQITLTQSMKLKGNNARLFGALAIIIAAYGLPHLHALLDVHAANLVSSNEVFKSTYDLMLGAVGMWVAAWVTVNVVPHLRIPAVKVSFKRQRA